MGLIVKNASLVFNSGPVTTTQKLTNTQIAKLALAQSRVPLYSQAAAVTLKGLKKSNKHFKL